MSTSDYPDFLTPGPIDSELAMTAASGKTIGAGSSYQLYDGPVPGLSYQLAFDAFTSAASPTAPFSQIILLWRNAGVLVDFQHWVVLTTNVSPAVSNSLFVLRGPTVAQHLAVLLENYDTNPEVVDATLFSSARTLTRHAGMQVSNNILGNYTLNSVLTSTPNSEPAGLVLGNSPGITLAASATTGRINAVWAGPAMFTLTLAGAGLTAGCVVTMYQVDPNYSGAGAFQEIWSNTYTANPALMMPVTLPRQPVMLTFQNLATSGAIDITWSLTATDIPS